MSDSKNVILDTFTLSVIQMPKSKYDELMIRHKLLEDENNDLKNKIVRITETDIKKLDRENERLKNENERSKSDIDKLNKENVNLRNENKKLKERIKKLEIENKELKERITILESYDKESKLTINQQTVRILTLEQRMLKMEEDRKLDKLRDKLKLAIIDIDQIFQLEKTEDKHFSKIMRKLRKSRDKDYHYIQTKDDPDSEELKQYKLHLIKNKLIEYKKSGDESIKYVDRLMKIIDNNFTIKDFESIDIDDKNEGEEWWIL
jgi:chromosome segregation ATPase